MNDDLIALAGELVYERKRLSESLRRLESTLLRGEIAKELFRQLGVQNVEGLHVEIDHLSRSLDRIGALTKTLVHQVNNERLVSCEPVLLEGALTVEQEMRRNGKAVALDCRPTDVRLDVDLLEGFKPVFLEMLKTLVEFCIENPKERSIRKKRATPYFQFEIKPNEDGYRLMVVCDGNGIIPPLAADHGLRLAAIGVRATFEGKPGQWSAWLFHLPSSLGPYRCVPVRLGERKICIPSFAIKKVLDRTADLAKELTGVRVLELDSEFARSQLDTTTQNSDRKFVILVQSGTDTVALWVDHVFEVEEVFMKPLHKSFTVGGRFLGVVVTDAPGSEEHNQLNLVLNPAYIVYGDEAVLAGGPSKSEEDHAV